MVPRAETIEPRMSVDQVLMTVTGVPIAPLGLDASPLPRA
jgi:hypothetical protein